MYTDDVASGKFVGGSTNRARAVDDSGRAIALEQLVNLMLRGLDQIDSRVHVEVLGPTYAEMLDAQVGQSLADVTSKES
jgi:hypothetical protein